MNSEKKMIPLHILKILHEYSDEKHKLTQNELIEYLQNEYGVDLERKAISRNLALLEESGFDIVSTRNGSYLNEREFTKAELHMLIDGVMASRYINENHTYELIDKLSKLSNRYFKPHIKNVYTIKDFSKTDNQELFLNIELIDEAIEEDKQVILNYNKYGADKKLHKTSTLQLSPYQFILHNQKYYLMAYNEKYSRMGYYRLDHITGIKIAPNKRTDIYTISGYINGIDYKDLSESRPYMFSDKAVAVTFVTETWMIDQIIDWFGKDISIKPIQDKIQVSLKVSLEAMEYWTMQYSNFVEIIQPESLRNRIIENLKDALKKYEKEGSMCNIM